MKFKHVKAMLIGATGIVAAGGIAVSQKAALHTAEVVSVEEKEALSDTDGNEGLFAGVKLEVSTEMESKSADIEALHLARTAQAGAELESETRSGQEPQETEDRKETATERGRTVEPEAPAEEMRQQEPEEEIKAEEKITEEELLAEEEATEEELPAEEGAVSEEEGERQDTQEEEPEIVIATVDRYLHVRSEPHLEGEIIGKLYNHSVGTLLEETGFVDENGGDDIWYRIESGSVNGFVKAEYVLRGEEGRALADEVGERIATVDTMTLRMRMEPSTESEIVGLLPEGDTLVVSEELEGWVKVNAQGKEGYISADYIKLHTENKVAESKEEEERRLAEEAARLERQRAQQAQSAQAQGGGSSSAGTQGGKPAPSKGHAQNASGGLGSQIANFALQFVGNPYVYGGTSLTNGADCSGFVMSVYQNFGISLPRTSGEQGNAGTAVAGIENARAGDLISYSGHIGIYIGNGQIVHASTPASGIKVSSATYRSIRSIRRIV